MTAPNPSMSLDPKELYSVITSGLPSIANYLKVVLKKEKLSEEAEAKRRKYEKILSSLEQGHHVGGRPLSIICDDDGGYFSSNRIRAGENTEQNVKASLLSTTGFLLWQDEKVRWRRGWCKLESRDMRFCVYEDDTEEVLLRSFSLENSSTRLESQVIDLGKDNCFHVSGVLYDAIGGNDGNEMEASVTPVDIYLAAYTESECKSWTSTLQQLLNHDTTRNVVPVGDSSTWPTSGFPQDSVSSSSSNFSSNRDSMISNTSSLVNTCRVSSRSDLGEGKEADDSKTFAVAKQQQPLPSPPQQVQVVNDEEPVPAPACEDDDNASVGTIYESIDNLVLQFDDAIRNMGENLKPGAKQTKKKDRSIFRQHSFLSSRTKSSKSNLWSEKRSEFEKGERYSGFMFKKNSGGSWKKKWCVLKGCIFGYYKSRHDSHGHECIILNGTVQDVQDERKSFVFYLSCTGVQDMYFAVEEEEVYFEWLSKLRSACASAADYSHALQSTEGRVPAAMESSMLIDSIYNIPRPLSMESQMYDTPNTSAVMTPNAAIDAGIYNVPRNLLIDDSRFSSVHEDGHFSLDGETLDLYDYPRVSMSPDEEGIYDDPLDIVDMEIYDYPPDAGELGLEYPDWITSENTRRNTVGESISVDLAPQNWKDQAVPPLPNTSRPVLFGSAGIISDTSQRAQNFPASKDVEGDRPKSHPPGLLTNMTLEGDQTGYARGDFLSDHSTEAPDSSHLEYGQCTSRGYLYKKERFMTWVRLYCIIRNNFLECHKVQGDTFSPTLKLFLPGSEVKEGGGDAKKKWAFQVKHPRREGSLVFACDSEEELRQWMQGFQSGSSIQVQPVNTVEEIRITDLEMQKRWTAMDKGASVVPPVSEDAPAEIPPRRKTFSAGTVPDDFASDTLKRRRKFSWVKSNFMRRKSEKKFMSGSQTDLNANRLSSSTFSAKSDSISPLHVPDPLRKSVSLELLPTATELSPNILSDNDNFQGYLRVQRKGADSVWVRYWCVLEDPGISCYISQRDLTLTLSIQLLGARVSTSELECQRKHSFKVYHMDSGQCLYFAADSHDDFLRWFAEITKKGQQVADDNNLGPTYFISSDPELLKRLSVVSEGGSSNVSDSSSLSVPQSSGTTASTVFYRGRLLKSSHTGKWKQRYCIASDGSMAIFRSSTDKVPIIAISLRGISLELISTPRNSRNEFQFKLNPCSAGKSHTFAAPSETEMYAWISGLRDASSSIATVGGVNEGPVSQSPAFSERSLKKRSKKLKDADLVSYVPASTITNPDYSGYANIQYGTEPWTTYWCLAYSNCLYIYQNKLSSSTVKTVVLPGYEIKIGDLQSSKHLYNLSLQHEGVSPVLMSVESQEELNNWITQLSKYSRAEGAVRQKKISGKLLPGEAPSKIKVASREKKGPVKANHSISGVKSTLEERSESNQTEVPAKHAEPQNSQEAIIRRYEKRIKKTERVANQTELKLKKQRSSLLHFKKELSRHVVTLQGLSESGDPHAQKRLKNVRMKLAQLEKIVPYLGKYVSVNRQAEMQTIAVLKESCTMELQKFSQKHSVSSTPMPGSSNASPLPLKSPQQNGDSQPDCQSPSQPSYHYQDTQPDYQPLPPQNSQAGYLPPPQDSQPGNQLPPPEDLLPGNQLPPPQDSQPGNQPPPLHQLPLLQDAQPDYQPPPLPPENPLPLPEENPYASLSEIKKEPPVKLRSNYAELDFGRVRGSDNLRPPSVKYCEVRIDSLGIGRITPDTVSSSPIPTQEKIGDSDSMELHDTTLTPDNVTLLDLQEKPESLKHQFPEQPPLLCAPAEAVKSKSPPAIAKKPNTKLSPIHSSTHQPLTCDSSQKVTNTDSNLEVPSSARIAAGPSVADRIKALQHHHH